MVRGRTAQFESKNTLRDQQDFLSIRFQDQGSFDSQKLTPPKILLVFEVPLDSNLAIFPHPFNWRSWVLNLGPSPCRTDVLPLRYSPTPYFLVPGGFIWITECCVETPKSFQRGCFQSPALPHQQHQEKSPSAHSSHNLASDTEGTLDFQLNCMYT